MKRKFLYIFYILIFNLGKGLSAEIETIKIIDYSYKEGLTTSGVTCVYKDSKGFLWLCAKNGLFKYDGYSFKNINSIANGFLKFETYCVIEDSRQNLWIGTAGKGVFYYNTHTGELFNLKLSVGSNAKINRILFFQKKIWLASNEGLLVFDEKDKVDQTTFFEGKVLWPEPMYKFLQMNVINFIYTQPGSKSLWVGTNGPLYELNIETYKFNMIVSNFQYSIRWLSNYMDRNILVSSWDGGVFAVNPQKQQVENDPFIEEMNKIIGTKRVMSAVMDKHQNCWIATFGDGLYIFSKDKNGKLTYENFQNNESQPLKLKSNFLDQIFIDSTGIAWISMAESGLAKVYFQKNNFHSVNFHDSKDKTRLKEITAIYPSTDNTNFWISFNDNEIDLFDTKNQRVMQFTSKSNGLRLQNDKIRSTYQDKKGNLWIVYAKIGLYIVPSNHLNGLSEGKSTGTISPIDANKLLYYDPRANSYITCFYEDSKGRLWVGTWVEMRIIEMKNNFIFSKTSNDLEKNSKKILVFTKESDKKLNFITSPIYSIIEIENNKFWLGTRDEGIIEIKEGSNLNFTGKNLELNEKLPSNNVKCFYMDKSRNLWIGTNSGLCYLENNNLRILNLKHGLSSECVNNIVEDKNKNIWISTSYGISKINRKDFSIEKFYHSDQEKLNQYISNAAVVASNHTIWFSTNESLVSFHPDSVKIGQTSLRVFFTDIKINNHSITPSEKYHGIHIIDNEINQCQVIKVPYGSALYIEFAALDYLNPERILYKYKIGKNSEWIILSPGQRSLNLPNMTPGEYTLSIEVANLSNINAFRSIKINYLPPIWLSKTAYAIYVVILLFLLFSYRKLLIQKTNQKSLIEKERYERKKIEELDKMKSEFFSNISHEFRTPLSLIINPLEKLIDTEDISDKNKDKMKLVLKSSNRLLKLTNELMDFSKIENDLLQPDFERCEMVSMTKEIGSLFNNLADSNNIDFKINYTLDQIEIPIDKGMIEKSIFNLLSNAFKYTPINGIIMVNISMAIDQETEYVKISVINTGEGISHENLTKIFDRYYQVNNVQNKNIEGTGIGLALVKNFVALHSGKLEVKSELKLETCFDIYLPVKQPDYKVSSDSDVLKSIKSAVLPIQIKENESAASKQNFHYQVLVVEDDDDIRNYIVEGLSAEYKILSAKNGEEGLNLANETIPDLIITDVLMPVLSGIELCKKLKNQVITSHIPIIILSAKTTTSQQIEGIEMGADVYMIKPFNIDVLKAQVQRLISFKQAIYSKYLKETSLIPQDSVTNKLDDEFMRKILSFIEGNLTNSDLNVDQLANCVSLSKVQTYRKVKAISGQSIVEFIRTVRLKKASQLILENHLNFSEIAFETGFSTPSYFSKCFHDHFGITPSEFATEYGDRKALPDIS
jgi:signal transduction histidine kinase/ligand-binding sensor domain-containing protein/DNA-binding response OmpR family regulator